MATDFSDEYVINAMLKDAEKKSSIKYSALGGSTFAPLRPSGAAPKPNTRFLRNILRETDTHNAALLAKEKGEARERERAFRHQEPGRLSPPPRDVDSEYRRKRRRGREVEEEEHSIKRRHEDDSDKSEEERRRRRRHRHRHRDRTRSRSGSPRRRKAERKAMRREPEATPRSRRKDLSDMDDDDDLHKRRKLDDEDTEQSQKQRHKAHWSERRYDSPSQDGRYKKRDEVIHGSTGRDNKGLRKRISPSPSDSDPLEAFVGPLPPPQPKVRPRGRGAFSSRAAMDEHFASGYDPKIDVQPDAEEEDDWDQALEAMRDRQRWKQQGADRLRAAGFSESEVKKWEKGGEKDESDVRWAKRGEGREWDRGKVVDSEGVQLAAEWGRLKDT